MTPLQVCEPLLQYICRLNRSARKGGNFDMSVVRSQITELFDQIRRDAAAEPALAEHFDYGRGQLELVLMFFVDFMIKESKLPFAAEWQELAVERHNEMAGDEKFFDLLDEALADPSEAVAPRLAVYYACIGLGLTGWYTGQAEHLRKKMLEISGRIRAIMDVDRTARVCPEAYEHTNTTDLIQPPGARLFGIFLVAASLLVVLFVANVYLYRSTSESLDRALTRIVQADQGSTEVVQAEGASDLQGDDDGAPEPDQAAPEPDQAPPEPDAAPDEPDAAPAEAAPQADESSNSEADPEDTE